MRGLDGNRRHIEHPFEPVFDTGSRVLVLGTMASPKSREAGFFYGHPQNRFWKVMGQVFDVAEPVTTEERTAFLLDHRIALWDVLAACDIEGASDASIKNPVPSDLGRIFDSAQIRAVYTTGKKAYELFLRYQVLPEGVELVGLPSTSPANARASIGDLVASYRVLLRHTLPCDKAR